MDLVEPEGFPLVAISRAFEVPFDDNITVQNIVALMHFNISETLNVLAQRIPSAEYKADAVVVKKTLPHSHSVMIVTSGKAMITGCKSRADLEVAVTILINDIIPGANLAVVNELIALVNVQTITCSTSVGGPIDLETFVAENPSSSSFNPSQFPGVVFRAVLPHDVAQISGMIKLEHSEISADNASNVPIETFIRPVTALIFRSGKIIYTGGRAANAFNFANQMLRQYLCQTSV